MNYIDFLELIAKQSGEVIKNNFKLGMSKEYKGDDTPVTKTDKEINSLIIFKINELYPTHSVKGEEESNIKNESDYVWVCDPVDGTIPFSSGLPICTFSLALVYKGQPIAGVIYEPFMDRMLLAEKGKGTFLNGEKVSVNNRDNINEKSIIAIENFKNAKYNLHKIDNELTENINVKLFKLCSILYAGMMVAIGEFDGVIFPHITSHDGASLKIIVEEAGGKMTDIYGNEQRYDRDINGYIASNGKTHNQLVKIVSDNIILR
ncbi:MAG: inositol monophosphatase [Candidatus Gracilibacteria bacterium]